MPLCEEARATYISVARPLGEDPLEGGEHDLAARYFLRTLEKEPYDERARFLAAKFRENFEKFGADENLVNAGPRV